MDRAARGRGRRRRQRTPRAQAGAAAPARSRDSKVGGEFTFADAQLRIAGAPTLTKVNGKLAFTERDVRARDIAMEMLGGPAKLAIATADGRTRVTGGGTLTFAALRREYAERVSGSRVGSHRLDGRRQCAARGVDLGARELDEGRGRRSPGAARQGRGGDDAAAGRAARRRRAGAARTSSSRPTAGSRSSPRTASRAAKARPSIVRCSRSARRSSAATRTAPSVPGCGCAPSCRRSTSTTGSRCCGASAAAARGAQRKRADVGRRRSRRRTARGARREVQRSQGA